MKLIRINVIKDDFVIGATIFHNICQWLAPSILAASIIPAGTCMNACLRRNMPNMLTMLDMISPR